jgi:serine/threonine protein phosphatase PrpC
VLHVPEPALLLLYSDGLVESRHTDIDQGIAVLASLLDAYTSEPSDEAGPDTPGSLCQRLLHGASVTGGADDRTVLLAELTPTRV